MIKQQWNILFLYFHGTHFVILCFAFRLFYESWVSKAINTAFGREPYFIAYPINQNPHLLDGGNHQPRPYRKVTFPRFYADSYPGRLIASSSIGQHVEKEHEKMGDGQVHAIRVLATEGAVERLSQTEGGCLYLAQIDMLLHCSPIVPTGAISRRHRCSNTESHKTRRISAVIRADCGNMK